MCKKVFRKFMVVNLMLMMILLNFTFLNNDEVIATAEEGKFTIDELPYNIRFTQIETGESGAAWLALDTNGDLWAWGNNTYGQLGNGTRGNSEEAPIKIDTPTNFVQIASSGSASFGIDEDGNIWSWGDNQQGELGRETGDTTTPNLVTYGTKFAEIKISSSTVIALDESGNLWGWGSNQNGLILNEGKGNKYKTYSNGNSYPYQSTPIQMTRDKVYKDYYFDDRNVVAIDSENNYWIWGSNSSCQLGATSDTYSYKNEYGVTIYASYTPIKLNGGIIDSSVEIKMISVGRGTIFVLDTSGNLHGWGSGGSTNGIYGGKLGVDASDNPDYDNFYNIPTPILIGTGYTYVTSDSNDTVAIKTNGMVEKWGDGESKNYYWMQKTNNKLDSYLDYSSMEYAGEILKVIDSNGDFWYMTESGTFPTKFTELKKTYTVKFMNEGVTAKTETVTEGNSATAPTLTKAGYTLSWDTDFSNVTSNLTVNAIWTPNTNTAYKVEHYKQNTSLSGYTLAETENKTGTTGALAVATKKTYEGFTENTTYSERVPQANVLGDGSLVLKLYYDRNSYTVTLNTNDGTVNAGNVSNYKYGVGATLPTNVTKTGYTFAGWYANSEFTGNVVTSIGTTETGDKTYYAKWTINQYTVTFKDGENIEKTETVSHGSSATAPSLTKAGYTLSWDQEFSNVTNDITVNAVWTANTNTSYKVEHYLRNLDTEVEGYDLHETEELTGATDTTVTATPKTYEGFTENTTYSGRVASGTVAGDGSLVLKLYYNRNSYNITYELNGGTATSELTNTYTYGKELILSNRVTKQSYEFAGWYDNAELTGEAITSIGVAETGNKTYYAKWIQNEFTVIFKNGEETAKTETVTEGESATAPELTKEGYTLSWDTDFTNVTSDLTVNAVWTANTNTTYKVEHYLRTTDTEVEGYNLFETENLTGTTDTTVTAVAKTYEGFTENISYSGRVPSGNIAANGSLVLKLYYNRNSYNIAYELNGGTANGTLTTTYTYGKGVILSNRVTKQGHVFVGWYNNPEFTGETVTRITSSEIGDKTYYAKWTEEEFYITSERYGINVSDEQITKVSPKTNVTTFINNINTNGTVKVLNLSGVEVTGEELVGTGYKLQVDFKGTRYEYDIAVRGDLDGNGKVSVTDLSILNQIMVKRLTVTGVREKAADLDYSGKTTITDLSMMNQTIVGRITL